MFSITQNSAGYKEIRKEKEKVRKKDRKVTAVLSVSKEFFGVLQHMGRICDFFNML